MENAMSSVTSLLWLPRGKLDAKPKSYEPTEQEVVEWQKAQTEYKDDFEKEYNEAPDFIDAMMADISKDHGDDSEEDEDELIKESDFVLCVGKVGDPSSMEYQVFDTTNRSLFIQRDVMLPYIPLCMDYKMPYVLVSSFEPVIEMWNANYYDKMTPDAVFEGHEEAVLSIRVNRMADNLMLSGSADHSVKLWDISTQKAVKTYKHHKDKVQSICWNEYNPVMYATGGFDGKIYLGDSRSTDKPTKLKVGGEVECIEWGFDENEILCSNHLGEVMCYDLRNMQRKFALGLSSGCTFAKSVEQTIVVSCPESHASSVSIWNLAGEKPDRLYMKTVDGAVLSVKTCPELPHLVAFGGANSQIWDLSCIKKLRKLLPALDALPRIDEGIFTPYDMDEPNEESDGEDAMEE